MTAMALTTLAAQGAMAAGNPLARGMPGLEGAGASINGTWNGTDLENRTACTHPEDEGNRGTYAQFDVSLNASTQALFVNQVGITGLQCTYFGTSAGTAEALSWTGTYTCGDGKHGSFTSRSILVTANALAIHLDIKLDTTETCTVEALIAGGRL
jgi:hypothetical protein